MAKRGRPSKPGVSRWIPQELIKLVDALKNGDRVTAAIEFGRWNVFLDNLEKTAGKGVDDQNKPDVN